MATLPAMFDQEPLAAGLHQVAERLRESVVAIDSAYGTGAGVAWAADGLIVTNRHVVPGDRARVRFPDGTAQTATILAQDPDEDLAALRVDRELNPAPVAPVADLRIGQLVLAVGHPLRLPGAVGVGVLSGLPVPAAPRDLLQASLRLNPGNSGGPLADAAGRVIGINTMVAGPRLALAIPSDVVRAFLARLRTPLPTLGVTAQVVPLPPSLWPRLGHAQPSGLVVLGVEPGSPAATAGLRQGDLIVAADGRPVRQPGHLRDALALGGAGHTLRLTVLRENRTQELVSRLAA